ncbi:MAG: GNAT family N-acetyltransferase [Planctomycetia bacterium]|nr:GNAT family N-acetyltransferase [Planctomycetia bacterium]
MEIRAARRAEAPAALELLLAECAPADRTPLAAGLLSQLPWSEEIAGGLFIADHDGAIAGVGLGQVHGGRTGSVWRPRFPGEDVDALGGELVRRSAAWLAAQDLGVLQSLVATPDGVAATWLQQCGFAHVARLGYLVWSDDHQALPVPSLRFTPVSPETSAILAEVIEQSYLETLDCPTLNGVRTTPEVLEGYREIGEHWPDAWLIAWRDDRPIGCLILADHPAANQCELVYMGLIPEARGQGLSGQFVAQAKHLARERSRARLVLAVDLQNAPALRLYANQGFDAWDERDVFVRINAAAR